jgi:hypothetical protein
MKRNMIAMCLLLGLGLSLNNSTYATNARSATGHASSSALPQTSPTLSVSDASLVEGNTGTTNMVFTVTLAVVGAHPLLPSKIQCETRRLLSPML